MTGSAAELRKDKGAAGQLGVARARRPSPNATHETVEVRSNCEWDGMVSSCLIQARLCDPGRSEYVRAVAEKSRPSTSRHATTDAALAPPIANTQTRDAGSPLLAVREKEADRQHCGARSAGSIPGLTSSGLDGVALGAAGLWTARVRNGSIELGEVCRTLKSPAPLDASPARRPEVSGRPGGDAAGHEPASKGTERGVVSVTISGQCARIRTV